MMKGIIYCWERNIRGALVLYGALGIRQYYGYSINTAKRKYIAEFKKTYFVAEV